MNESEDILVQRLKSRDATALEIFIDMYGSNVYKLVSRILQMLGNKEDIEECVSDVFVVVWNKIDDYDPSRGSLKVWVHILAKYRALDYRRKLARTLSIETIDTELRDNENVENRILLKIETEKILNIVKSLNDVDRSIFYKKYFFYESIETIANTLGLTNKAVESRLRRARNIVKHRLDPEIKEGLS